MKYLFFALQFLTRFPVPMEIEYNQETATGSLFFFPLISGMITLIVGFILEKVQFYNAAVAAFLGLFLWYLLNGGLHLDGLADVFDGFLSNRDRERTLEIMKDSRLGTFGAVALIFILVGKFSLLLGTRVEALSFATIGIYARLGVLFCIGHYPTARKGGMGNIFQSKESKRIIKISHGFWFLFTLIFFRKGLLLYSGAMLTTYCLSEWSMKKIGGVTGDVFGAVMEITELVLLIIYWGMSIWKLF